MDIKEKLLKKRSDLIKRTMERDRAIRAVDRIQSQINHLEMLLASGAGTPPKKVPKKSEKTEKNPPKPEKIETDNLSFFERVLD